jgi:pimeloyl-ACP methyl ester carboxylesterase
MKDLCKISILPSAILLFSTSGDVTFCHASSTDSGSPTTAHDAIPASISDENQAFANTHTRYLHDGRNKEQKEYPFFSRSRSSFSPIVSARRILTRQNQQQQQQQQQPQSLDFRDVLQCSSTQYPSNSGETEEYSEEEFNGGNYDGLFESDDILDLDTGGKLEGNRKLSHSPVVYQFYGRSRARGNPSDSVQFILLGPNVDHWKVIGQLLASKGFNAMACERLDKEETGRGADRSKDAPNLVLEILEVLKWNRVVLVGCDRESVLAMETAMMLAPDRVAGLVLCGELTEADRLASDSGFEVLDSFLRRIVGCPFVIVWDGDSPTLISGSSAHKAVETNSESSDRCLILGGGSAPHRTKPEQFAWILTRFVEEKLEVSNKKTRVGEWNERAREKSSNLLRTLNVPFGIDSVVSPEGRLLLGRAAAAALFYIAMMKVAVVQYGILRAGLLGIKSQVDSVATFRRKMFQAVAAFVLNYGYIPRLFKIKNYDEDRKREKAAQAAPVDKQPEGADKSESLKTEEEDTQDTKGTKVDDEAEDENKGTQKNGLDEEPMIPKMKPFFFLDHIVT